MATLKQRLHRKNSSGGYDTIHMETSADLVKRANSSTTVEQSLTSHETALAKCVQVSDDSIGSILPLDADTLGGHAADYFAKAGDLGKLDGAMLYSMVEKTIYASEYVQADNSVLNALGSGRAFKTLPAINQETGEFYTTTGYVECTGGSYGYTGSKATSYDTSWAYIKTSDGYAYFVPDDDHTICYYGWSVGTSGSTYYFSTDTAHKKHSIKISGTKTVGEIRDINGNLIEIGTKIETGSYTGTGTYGSSNMNNLTFGFVPKLIFIFVSPSSAGTGDNAIIPAISLTNSYLLGGYMYGTLRNGSYSYAKIDANNVSWYDPSSESGQMNHSGWKYSYIAIG